MSATARVERSARRLTPPLSMISTGQPVLVESTIADASHDRVGARLLTRGRFADFCSQLGEVVVGRFKDVTTFEFGALGQGPADRGASARRRAHLGGTPASVAYARLDAYPKKTSQHA